MFDKRQLFANIWNQIPSLVNPDEEDRCDDYWEADIPTPWAIAKMQEVMEKVLPHLPDEYYRWPHASGWEGSLRVLFWNRETADKDVLFIFEKEPRIFKDNSEIGEYYLHWNNALSRVPGEALKNPTGFVKNPSPELMAKALLWISSDEEKLSGTN